MTPSRDLHLYAPEADWARVVAARGQWQPGGRGGPMPAERTVEKALAVMEQAPGPVGRDELMGVAPASYVRAVAERATAAGMDPRRLAAARLFWRLAERGDACVANKVGAAQMYATRAAWFPKLSWPKKPQTAARAAAALARRYLAVYGPATATDVAHFFGARVSDARTWLAAIEADLTTVRCGDREGLVARSEDVRDLLVKPPTAATQWPLRLLPLWESMLMGHADKSWTVPDEADRKRVWRKAAFVSAVVLARGRAVATWTQSAKRSRVVVEVAPLSPWSKTKHASQVRREARAVAAHLELEHVEVNL